MSYDENESSKVKADNPLTPKQDNSWMEAIPLKRNPWDAATQDTKSSEASHSPIGTVEGSLLHDPESSSHESSDKE